MLNTQKLLYILPDLAYIAELLPGKQEHSFSIQAFKQLNGNLIDTDRENIISANIQKLVQKLEAGETYFLILPDFLFTNTIIEVAKETEKEVIEHIKTEVLPDLQISTDTHLIKPFVLTQHGGSFKVQLTAIEKAILEPIAGFAKQVDAIIEGCTPLSWSLKSVVSLEPSITIAQLGSYTFLAEHYIGVDQSHYAAVSEVDTLAETIKTLKGAEPSIQTVYMLSNPVVEEKLTESLSTTIPLQQLTTATDEETELPSHLKRIIEAGMKTLSIKEYAAPQFETPTISDEATEKYAALAAESKAPENDDAADTDPDDLNKADELDEDENDDQNQVESTSESEEETMTDLPKPTAPKQPEEKPTTTDTTPIVEPITAAPAAEAAVTTAAASMKPLDLDANDASEPEKTEDSAKINEVETTDKPEKTITTNDEPVETTKPASELEVEKPKTEIKPEPKIELETEIKKAAIATPVETAADEEETEDLAKFAAAKPEPAAEKTTTETKESKPVRKQRKQTQGASMLRMIMVFFGVFILTVAVGVGIGFGFIKYSQSKTPQAESPVVVADNTTPTPEPTPEPTPTPEAIDKSAVSILVVNATTIAGYAGETQDSLEADGFESIDVGNAEGDYEPGIYIQMSESDAALQSAIEDAMGETLTNDDNKTVEDPDEDYDIVIVLAE